MVQGKEKLRCVLHIEGKEMKIDTWYAFGIPSASDFALCQPREVSASKLKDF